MLVLCPMAAEIGASRRPPTRTALMRRFCTECLLSKRHGRNDRAGLVVSSGTVDIPVLFPYSEVTGRRGSEDRQRAEACLEPNKVATSKVLARLTATDSVGVPHFGRWCNRHRRR